MVNPVCDHGIPVTVTCGHCLAAWKVVKLETRIRELEAALRHVGEKCRGELGCKGYSMAWDLLPQSETKAKQHEDYGNDGDWQSPGGTVAPP